MKLKSITFFRFKRFVINTIFNVFVFTQLKGICLYEFTNNIYIVYKLSTYIFHCSEQLNEVFLSFEKVELFWHCLWSNLEWNSGVRPQRRIWTIVPQCWRATSKEILLFCIVFVLHRRWITSLGLCFGFNFFYEN